VNVVKGYILHFILDKLNVLNSIYKKNAPLTFIPYLSRVILKRESLKSRIYFARRAVQ